ncbi:MAG: ABC transporter permease [Epsilonproteobacteria bacterium]|nr:ABC transporter permease [Campylobacterota bacterium]
MTLSSYLIKKYLRFDKSQPFITVSAILAFVGVMVGVMVLIVAMAIMNGFDKNFEDKLFTMNYPLSIYPKSYKNIDAKLLEKLRKEFPYLKFSPYINSQAIIKRGDKLEGGMLFGVNFKDESAINPIIKKAIGSKDIKRYEVVVGKGIKDMFFLDNGDKITLIFTKNSPAGFSLIPTMKRFKVAGSFDSGLIAYDRVYMYTTLDSLQKILHFASDEFSGIHIYSKNPQADIKKIKEVLPDGVGVVGWWQQNGNFFAALALEKRSLFIVLMLIILIASLNIISSLLMIVMNRRKEIALLLSLGASKKEIRDTFFRLGMVIGGSGIVVGVVVGLIVMYLLGSFDIISLPADVYGMTKLPIDLSFKDFFLIVIGAFAIVAFSSYYPSKQISKIDILATLRD